MTTHTYRTTLAWSGSTSSYEGYDRTHDVSLGPAALRVSADAAFRGDPSLANPEAMLVAAASSCQLLSFLSEAARAGVEVIDYDDEAEGRMPEAERPIRITEIVLRPRVVARGGSREEIERLLHRAHDRCYIANSLTSTVTLEPTVELV